ncbi:MAG: hypothetical protein CM15mP8_0440 [Methanobacteriota archaeon]|nr:MAG: hypothetical protein CM15mP8_0440 [Euryarchaeota archaeon]
MGYYKRHMGRKYRAEWQVDRVTAYESSNGDMWVSWGELRLDLTIRLVTLLTPGMMMMLRFPNQRNIEYDNEVLFATEDGVARYDRVNDAWLSTWQENNGLPGNSGSEFYELWTNGVDLVLGGGDGQAGRDSKAGDIPLGGKCLECIPPRGKKGFKKVSITFIFGKPVEYRNLQQQGGNPTIILTPQLFNTF